jgi:probable O-glycosylation ligase (exosortase A-associated)
MNQENVSIPETGRIKPEGFRTIITWQHLILFSLVLISLISGLLLPVLREKFQYLLILAFPALLVVFFISRNAFFGVCCFYIYEFSRPDNFFPALRPLKIVIIIEAITAISFILYLIINDKKIKWDKFSSVFLFFLIVMATGIITADNNRFAYDYTKDMASTFLFFVIATNVTNSLKRVKILVSILLIIHIYFAIKGIVTGGFVGGSLMGDENDYALALNVMIPFPFFFFMKAKKRLLKMLFLLILVAFVGGVIASLSRGGWVGLMAVLIYCIFRSRRKFAGIMVFVMLSLVAVVFAPKKYWQEIETVSDTNEATARTRLEYWATAVRMYMAYPITGLGAANGGFRMPEFYVGKQEAATRWGRTFHGTLPQILAELGTLGMAAYLLMMYLALRYLFWLEKLKLGKDTEDVQFLSKAIIGGIIGYIATSAFLSTAYYPQIWTLYMLAISLTFIGREKISHPPEIAQAREIIGEN